MFAGTVQQMRGPSAELGPSSQSNSVAIAKAAALQSLNRPVTKATLVLAGNAVWGHVKERKK